MIVTAIVDPTALDSKYWKNNKPYQVQIERFLSDILVNGLLISDQKKRLLHELGNKIRSIPKAKILFEEIEKNKRVIKCKHPTHHQKTWRICCELEQHQSPDVIITGKDHLVDIRTNISESQVITFDTYLNSDFKKKRDGYLIVKPLHELRFSECEDLFTRVIQFASKIRIYDKQIGKGKNLLGFSKGISFILRLWKEADSYCNKTVEVEIYTFQADHGYTENAHCQETAETRIDKDLVGKLKKDFELPLKLWLFTFMSGAPVFGGLRGTDPVLRDRSKLHGQTAVCFGIHAHEL